MKRSWTICLLALPLALSLVIPVAADVRTRERTQFKLEGMLGRVAGMFGGKAAREGVLSTTAVKGNRKSSINENSGQIIDLSEEKVYDIDFKKKQYEVTTFAELRRRMQEAKEKAEKDAQREEQREEKPEKSDAPRKEYEVDFDAKETGQKKQLAGYDTRQVIMTVTIREKGKQLEEAGGFVMTADSWLGPEIAALKELTDFDTRYYTKLYGADAMAISAEQMAMVMAMYPMIKDANDRLKKEGVKLQGTPLATTTTFDVVKSKAQMTDQSANQGGGGLGGMLARRMKKEDPKPRATVLTLNHEFLEVAKAAEATDVEIPAGFKEKK